MENSINKSNANRRVLTRKNHQVSRKNISKSALKVLYRLNGQGHQAYLVGGSVRDLLLGGQPKDFDIATDATPEEVRSLFGNSRLIGRRFRLAHVRFGRELIEVATFRTSSEHSKDDRETISGSGQVLRDNVWGTLEDDVWRRDFTANALYYDVSNFSVIDYVDGIKDIEARHLKLIGNPQQRYREDPVRMLRAIRFAAKLDFCIDEETARPLADLGSLLVDIPSARLFDEFNKLFQSGYALKTFQLLREHNLFGSLFPFTNDWLDEDSKLASDRLIFIESALQNTDERISNGQTVTPMFLFAVFLWGPVSTLSQELMESKKMSRVQSLIVAAAEITTLQVQRIAIPKRFSFPMREIIRMQPYFDDKRSRRVKSMLKHRRFRAAYDLMLLRVNLGEIAQKNADWWSEVQKLPESKKTLSRKRKLKRAI
ncbi:MAG: polynucleotide adenylyltransferase PcnB [Pseudomonadota bacterium]|nr:polynucleotide adenylyltransferase PcnB [Pseudomonadota bacterium]